MKESALVCLTEEGSTYTDIKNTHVILSIDEYNTLVRQVNIMKLLLLELIPEEKRHGLVEKMLKLNNTIH